LMINYVDLDISQLGIRKFIAKILQDNEPSIKLFQSISGTSKFSRMSTTDWMCAMGK